MRKPAVSYARQTVQSTSLALPRMAPPELPGSYFMELRLTKLSNLGFIGKMLGKPLGMEDP